MKNLKAQVEQKKTRNGTDVGSSPEGEVLENGSDPNIVDMQSKAYKLRCFFSSVYII